MPHTPGPWTAQRWWETAGMTLEDFDADERAEQAARKVTRVEGPNGETICAAHDLAEILQANAALIAEAPAMLDLLACGIEDADGVVASWERGDLAGAVNALRLWADQARQVMQKLENV